MKSILVLLVLCGIFCTGCQCAAEGSTSGKVSVGAENPIAPLADGK